MIKAIDLRGLRNSEYMQFMGDFTALVDANDPAALNVAPQNMALKNKGIEIDGLFKLTLKNEITEELVMLDKRRDNAINGIVSYVNAYLYHFDPVLVIAANHLNNNLKVYGASIASQNLQSETATITSVVGDWENKPNLVAAIGNLNLIAWKNELKAANILFNQKYLARTQEYGAANPENMKLKREETNVVYYELRKFLDAHFTIINTPEYASAINQLNALVDQYNTLLNNRLAGAAVPPVVPPVV